MIGILIALYKARIPGFPENRQGNEQVVFSGEGRRDYLLLPLSIFWESRNSGLAPGNQNP